MAEYTQTYWNKLIDKYRNGTISENERFQLEKQALDDPFLFDALEGFALYESESDSVKKIEKKKTTIFTLPRIAAAASLVFLVAVMINLKSNNSAESESDNSIAMVLENEEKDQDKIQNVGAIDKHIEAPTSTSENGRSENTVSDADARLPESVGNKAKSEPKGGEKRIKKANRTRKADRASKPRKDGALPETFMDQDDGNIGNNAEEEIEIAQNESKLEDALEPVEAAAADVTTPYAEISELGQAVDMVSVASDSNARQDEIYRKKRSETSSIYYQVVPVIGKKIFDEYAKDRIDKRGLRQEKPQEVTIEFLIDENGNLSDFHHIFTGCSECGPFAISILQNSGEWKTLPSGFSGKARYTFIF